MTVAGIGFGGNEVDIDEIGETEGGDVGVIRIGSGMGGIIGDGGEAIGVGIGAEGAGGVETTVGPPSAG